jgi:hypothetical protein
MVEAHGKRAEGGRRESGVHVMEGTPVSCTREDRFGGVSPGPT